MASNASVDRSSVQFGLTSLQNLLTSSPNLASIFSTKEQLLPLYECFSMSVASEITFSNFAFEVVVRRLVVKAVLFGILQQT